MAKYNAIYEGRLPHGMYKEVINDSNIVYRQRFAENLIDSIIEIYKRYFYIFR